MSVIEMKAARKKQARAAYSKQVLAAFDSQNAEERRDRKTKEQLVRGKAKKAL
ncbi:hypothetical protein [Cupriavidus metallidurans]|uniref:hypothetical protein n=1 Tax=Cupriavidus metallidurans TaxID=119219 RepID=UPI00164FC673|nr:hypothetical protein [Cupriavidus metallidurans]